jgi:hypothetical protein
MLNLVLGTALLLGGGYAWSYAGKSKMGRIVQAVITAAAYGLWLSIVPISIFFVAKDIHDALNQERLGAAVFIAVASLTLIPMFVIALIPWNFFCRYMWKKVGLRLPQTDRLAGKREYYDWERQR